MNSSCRLSSVVEHAHGKGGVMSSNLIVGSTKVRNFPVSLSLAGMFVTGLLLGLLDIFWWLSIGRNCFAVR